MRGNASDPSVERFGETTSSQFQVSALRRLGIQATFRTDGRGPGSDHPAGRPPPGNQA